MCDICGKFSCDTRCPNVVNEVEKCAYCGEDIFNGETHCIIDGENYHAECVSGMSIYELAELFNFSVLRGD